MKFFFCFLLLVLSIASAETIVKENETENSEKINKPPVYFTIEPNGGSDDEKIKAKYNYDTRRIEMEDVTLDFIRKFLPELKLFNSKGKEISLKSYYDAKQYEDQTMYMAARPSEWFVWPNNKRENNSIIELEDVHEDYPLYMITLNHGDPHVFMIDDFLSIGECDELVSLAEQKGLVRSVTHVGGEVTINEGRTSHQTWLDQKDNNLVNEINERALRLIRMESIGLHEQMQVAKYDEGGHYGAHLDAWPQNPVRGPKNRFITLLIYLNDVEEGGETAFPVAGDDVSVDPSAPFQVHECTDVPLKVEPKKGRAVLFYNLKPPLHMLGRRDLNSRHTGCPVKKGHKWIANLWYWNMYSNYHEYRRFTGDPPPSET